MARFRRFRLLSRLLIFGFLLAVVPVIVMGAFSYINVTRRIDDNANLANQNLLKLITDDVEEQLMHLDQSMLELCILPSTLESLTFSAYRYNWTTFENVNSLKRRVDELRMSFESASGITPEMALISELGHWVIGENGFYSTSTERVQGVLEAATYALQDDATQVTASNAKLLVRGDTLYIVRGIYGANGRYYGALVAAIPQGALLANLEEMEQTENLLMLDRENAIVSARFTGETPFDAPQFLETYSEQLRQGQVFSVEIDGRRWGVSTAPSKFAPEWQYVRLVSYSPLQDDRLLFGFMLAVITLSILSVALFALLTFSRRLYRPIAALISRVSPEAAEAEEAGDEFAIISRYLSTVNESKRLLEGTLEEQRGQLRSLFFVNLLEGQLSREQVALRASRLELPKPSGWYCVSLYHLERIDDSGFDRPDTDLILFAVKNIADELLANETVLYSGVYGNHFVVLHQLCCASQEEARQQVAGDAARLLQTAGSALRVRFGCGVSGLYADLYDTAQAYRHAVGALRYRARTDENPISFYERQKSEGGGDLTLPQQPLGRLLEAIRDGAAQAAYEQLHAYCEALFEQSLPYADFEYAILRVSLEILDNTRAAFACEPGDGAPELAELLQLGYSREAERWICQHLLEPFFALREQEQPLSLSEQVARIVQEEYETPLTLEYCSSKVGYHPSYVSRVFRQQMGYSFKEYLCLYRIGRSKQMLATTDLKIQEISNRLCYNNPQNFIRVFKKMEGMTPGEYRARHGAGAGATLP